MDIRMPVCDGICATRLIKAEMPEIKIVILTTSTEDEDLFEAVKSGASGYLLKSMDAESLIEALHDARQDIPPFAPGLAARLLAEFARTTSPSSAETPADAPSSMDVVTEPRCLRFRPKRTRSPSVRPRSSAWSREDSRTRKWGPECP